MTCYRLAKQSSVSPRCVCYVCYVLRVVCVCALYVYVCMCVVCGVEWMVHVTLGWCLVGHVWGGSVSCLHRIRRWFPCRHRGPSLLSFSLFSSLLFSKVMSRPILAMNTMQSAWMERVKWSTKMSSNPCALECLRAWKGRKRHARNQRFTFDFTFVHLHSYSKSQTVNLQSCACANGPCCQSWCDGNRIPQKWNHLCGFTHFVVSQHTLTHHQASFTRVID